MKQSVKMIVGNWKMNGEIDGLAQFERLAARLIEDPFRVEVAICPPATLIERFARIGEPAAIGVGGQDCHVEPSGAYTGSVSAGLLVEAGSRFVIVGHSERRQMCGESDDIVSAKAGAALRAGLDPIICVGETLGQRQAGQAVAIVRHQILGSLHDGLNGRDWALAYEPVWAIGTGLTPTLEQIAEIHAVARDAVVERLGEGSRRVPILYGGSVTPETFPELLNLPEVAGGLVGGASLDPSKFAELVRQAG